MDYTTEVKGPDGIWYNCSCDLAEHGSYLDIPQSEDDEGGYDIIWEPRFTNWFFEDTETGLEVEADAYVKLLAKEKVNEQYWIIELGN